MHLPEPHKLIGFFGIEPEVEDPDLPWQYNSLTFRFEQGDEALDVEMTVSYGKILLTWHRADSVAVRLQVYDVQELKVESDRLGEEALIATFPEGSPLRPLRLRVAPRISLLWGTEAFPPPA